MSDSRASMQTLMCHQSRGRVSDCKALFVPTVRSGSRVSDSRAFLLTQMCLWGRG